VDNAPQKTQAFRNVVLVVPDIVLADPRIQGEETFHASGFRKNIRRIALLRYFDHNRLLQVENVFTAKQVDALGAARELVVKERVVTGPPAYLRDVEVAGNPFPNARKRNGATRNGFIRTDNYRARVLKILAGELGLPKLNFQVLRRTMATLAQTKGGVKDVQAILGHSKADTTVNVYMQPIEAGVKQTLDAIYSELTATELAASS
jgi:integrase